MPVGRLAGGGAGRSAAPANLGASVYQRLRNMVRDGRVPGAARLDQVMTAFAAEGVLRRLAAAGMLGEVVLKGARLWSAWGLHALRPTADFDCSCRLPALRGATGMAARAYADTVALALARPAEPPDGLDVEADSLSTAVVDSALGGCAVEGVGRIHTARVPVVVEVGFGHTLPDGATRPVLWRPLLEGIGQPLEVEAYTPEMWAAEKLRIALAFGEQNTRLKDFWDLRLLARMPMDRDLLARCLAATARDFGVALPATAADAPGLGDGFAARCDALWRGRRWPEWTGRPFRAGEDPSLPEAAAGIRAWADGAGLLAAAIAAGAPRLGDAPGPVRV